MQIFALIFTACLTNLIGIARGRNDRQFTEWCQRRSLAPADCEASLKAWCGMNSQRMANNRLCRLFIAGETTTRSPWVQSNPTSESTPKSRDDAKPKKVEKADTRLLNKMQEGMNGFAQKFVQQAARALASPLMAALKKAPKAEPTYSELTLNDPANYFQADIDLTKVQAAEILRSFLAFVGGKRVKRKVGKLPNYELWESFPIAYQFSDVMTEKSRDTIREAIKMWEGNTCVRFQENGGGTDRIEFVDGGGCSSFVGRAGGTQEITLHQPGCIYAGIIAHEIGHSLGFFHEQNRPDQKENVNINFDSINPARYNNFLSQKPEDVNDYEVPYDFGSVMHYDPRVKSFQLFSFLEQDYIIVAKDPHYQNTMGQRKGPSFADYLAINRAYCSSKCSRKLGCQHGGYEDPNNCSKCKCPKGFGGKTCNEVEASSCGGKLNAASTPITLASPGFPGKFPIGSECIWYITAPAGSRVFIKVRKFDFKCKDTCDENFLEVKTGPEYQRTGYRMCCKDPGQIASRGNEMIVIFSGQGTPATNGVQFEYWTDAKGVGPPATSPPTPGPPSGGGSTTSPIPSTFAPGQDCPCSPWSSWSACDYDCGGCGFESRSRSCAANKPETCEETEKKHCNFESCGDHSGPLFRKGRFVFFYDGCCLGLLNSQGECKGLERAIGDGIQNVFGGLFRNNGQNGK